MAMVSWGTHLVGVFPIPQHPCHINGMGAVPSRSLSWEHCGSWSANGVLVKEGRR